MLKNVMRRTRFVLRQIAGIRFRMARADAFARPTAPLTRERRASNARRKAQFRPAFIGKRVARPANAGRLTTTRVLALAVRKANTGRATQAGTVANAVAQDLSSITAKMDVLRRIAPARVATAGIATAAKVFARPKATHPEDAASADARPALSLWAKMQVAAQPNEKCTVMTKWDTAIPVVVRKGCAGHMMRVIASAAVANRIRHILTPTTGVSFIVRRNVLCRTILPMTVF